MFNKSQKKYISELRIAFDFDNPTEANWIDLEEEVSNQLMSYGFDEGYEPNQEGMMCESILDVISEE